MKTLASLLIAALIALAGFLIAAPQETQRSTLFQSKEDADRKSTGCESCHGTTEAASMHPSSALHLGCVDCHGGNVNI